MKEIVIKFGVFREPLTDGAPDLTGRVVEQQVLMLQADQTNPVPDRSQMRGLVERFHPRRAGRLGELGSFYAYNSGRHSTVCQSFNELIICRILRSPNELLRQANVTEAGGLVTYHAKLLQPMKSCHACAERARERVQRKQAK
ncbi:hypothetical protein PHMEG_00014790 [Phytophthora megakarya]|uniref:Uncharacterized protein n=1 Tax=Phytophthora megakarya TaxID=4795 RepID=A0A225W2X6_9STRA|nr:hypothetical protein PHMEG_00014790 [Phytophthora megakarya]